MTAIKGCIAQDDTYQKVVKPKMLPIKGYTTKDDTHQKVTQPMMTLLDVTCFLVFQGLLINLLMNIFCVHRKKKTTKYSETIRIGINVEVLVLVRGNPQVR